LTHHTFKGIYCLFSPYNFCLLCDQSITLRILLLSNLNFKICTWFCTFFVHWLLSNGHSLIGGISVTFWANKYQFSKALLQTLHQHSNFISPLSKQLFSHNILPSSTFLFYHTNANEAQIWTNRLSLLTAITPVRIANPSSPLMCYFNLLLTVFFPTPNCFKISFLCSWWLCFKHLWGRWTAHFLTLLEQIKKS
jgi:hypothetical protein